MQRVCSSFSQVIGLVPHEITGGLAAGEGDL
jgi:hypothetical protein